MNSCTRVIEQTQQRRISYPIFFVWSGSESSSLNACSGRYSTNLFSVSFIGIARIRWQCSSISGFWNCTYRKTHGSQLTAHSSSKHYSRGLLPANPKANNQVGININQANPVYLLFISFINNKSRQNVSLYDFMVLELRFLVPAKCFVR